MPLIAIPILSAVTGTPFQVPSNNAIQKFVQCPYDESACQSDIDCGESAMGRRAGYFCATWPFYSGGFAECCDEDWTWSTCAHYIYSEDTEGVFCDFWYQTQHADAQRLDICDCKINNGQYCQSWICVASYGYDLSNGNVTKNEAFLQEALMPNAVEIRGVDRCGYFDDDELTARNVAIGRWCYKYNDFRSCFCVEGDDALCLKWKCHRFLNNEKNGLSMADAAGHDGNRWNLSIELSTKVAEDRYECKSAHSVEGDHLQSTHCTLWSGDVRTVDGGAAVGRGAFSVMECEAKTPWTTDHEKEFDLDDDDLMALNVSKSELMAAAPYKWQCHGVGMEYRDNTELGNFWASTLVWSLAVGLGLLSLILCWMRYKYMTISSFFCVQTWFLFIFGSIAAVHGGLASLSLYVAFQTLILCNVMIRKCKNRGKVPYGSLAQKYDFDPMEESVSRVSDDDQL